MKRRPESTMSNVSEEEATWLKEQIRSAGADMESTTIARDLAGKLLDRLSPEDRMVLVMLEVEGLSVSEIAESTKWSHSKVKVRAHRARASLRRVLRDSCNRQLHTGVFNTGSRQINRRQEVGGFQ